MDEEWGDKLDNTLKLEGIVVSEYCHAGAAGFDLD